MVRKRVVRRRAEAFVARASRNEVTGPEGVRLEYWLDAQPAPRPLVAILHGWLGSANSGYTLSAAMQLHAAGFNIARINLRDHGQTAHLNEELFNSARITEVLHTINHAIGEHGQSGAGVMGFSLGGNFALRIAKKLPIPTLAICPAIVPRATMDAIDSGWTGYRYFFVRKWHAALRAKQAAFPDRYDFTSALRLNTVSALTDLFVRDYSKYQNTDEYFDRYDLSGSSLRGTSATILATDDDPVIAKQQFDGLPAELDIRFTTTGGHCALLKNWRLQSFADDFAVSFFRDKLGVRQPGNTR